MVEGLAVPAMHYDAQKPKAEVEGLETPSYTDYASAEDFFEAVRNASREAERTRMTPEQVAEAEARMEWLREFEATFEDDTGQTLYSSALLPCPFCGAGSEPYGPRPWVQTSDALSGGWEARVVCGGCHVATTREWVAGPVTYLPTGEDITRLLAVEKAIATWNRRAR